MLEGPLEKEAALRSPADSQHGAWLAGEGTAPVSCPLETREETKRGQKGRQKAQVSTRALRPRLAAAQSRHVLARWKLHRSSKEDCVGLNVSAPGGQ